MKSTVQTHRALLCFLIAMSLLPRLSEMAQAEESTKTQVAAEIFVAQPAMHQVTLTGYTRARRIVDIVSEEAGRCVKVEADIGDVIGENGVFAELDNTYINLAVEKNLVDQELLKNNIAYNAKEVMHNLQKYVKK